MNVEALDPVIDRRTEELQIYTQLRQVLARADAFGLDLPAGLLAVPAKPPIGDGVKQCAADAVGFCSRGRLRSLHRQDAKEATE